MSLVGGMYIKRIIMFDRSTEKTIQEYKDPWFNTYWSRQTSPHTMLDWY